MTAAASHKSEEALELDALLSILDFDVAASAPALAIEEELTESELETAVSRAESQEAVNKHYEAEAMVESLFVAPVSAPIHPIDALLEEMTSGRSPAVLATVDSTIESEDAAVDDSEPEKEKKAETKPKKEPKEKKAPVRKHYSSKSERVTDKLGAELGDYTVLEFSDALLVGDALAAKQAETMTAMKEAGVKVQNRMTFFMEFAAGKSANLNNVARKALELLFKDGKLVTGEKGNLHLALLAHPYSVGAAKAMGGNTILAMQKLKMIAPVGKGEFVPNPNSLYLAKIGSLLGLS